MPCRRTLIPRAADGDVEPTLARRLNGGALLRQHMVGPRIARPNHALDRQRAVRTQACARHADGQRPPRWVYEIMKTILAVLSAILLAVLGFFAYGLDQWLGIVAFTYPYLLFCATTALLFWLAWIPILKKRAFLVGLSVFAILSVKFLLPPPSERILRSVLLKIQPGASADSIETIVKEAYDGSGYVLPRITREDARIYVSLLSQQSGNCTALILRTKDGVVVSGEYSAD